MKRLYPLIICVTILCLVNLTSVFADTVSELQQKISDRQNAIKKLEEEISIYKNEANLLLGQADSLSKAIKELDINRKKIQAEIKITENKIENANFEIEELSDSIGDKNERINDSTKAIAEILQKIYILSDQSYIEKALSSEDFAYFEKQVDDLNRIQNDSRKQILYLREVKVGLEDNKTTIEKKKTELNKLSKELNNQKVGLDYMVQEKNHLLSETKNSESTYRSIIAKKTSDRLALEREIYAYESALKIAFDPSSAPKAKSGILSWPLDNVFITQKFGMTDFAKSGAYNGKEHNGVDFRASVGTPIKSADKGVVVATGDTGILKSCYSYGKWILIKHTNGLSTMYGHLSSIGVKKGDNLERGEFIGLSGNTGYSTGPHLHMSLYVSLGVTVGTLPNSIGCKNVPMPLADRKAYLDPLSYLTSI